jgi:hypothetical protein
MRAIIYPIAAGCIATYLIAISGCESFQQKKPSAGAKPEYFPVHQAVAEASAAVTEYSNSEAGKGSGMSLRSAEFTFKVVETVTGEVGVNILILNVSGSIAGQRTKEIGYTYKKPSARRLVQPTLKSDLAKTIDQALRDAPKEINGIPLDEVSIKKDFGIEKKIGAGGQAQLSIVTIGPKVSAGNNTVQSVKLAFAKKP